MRFPKASSGAVALVFLMSSVAAQAAGPKGKSGSSGPKTTAAAKPAKGPSATPKAPRTTGAPKTTGASGKVKGGPVAKAPSTSATSKAARAEAKTTKKTAVAATTPTTTADSSTTATTTSPGSTSTTTNAIDFTSGKVGEKLTRSSSLRSKIESRLQASGYEGSVYQAAYGFKNLGQFVAATNVSQNLGVSFEQLKLQMTGLSVAADGTVLKANRAPDGTITLVDPADVVTPAPTKSLGQSIQTVKAGVDGTAAAQTATTQANAEISATSSTPAASTTSTTLASSAVSKKSTKKTTKPGGPRS